MTEIADRRPPGRPPRSGDFRPVAGKVPHRLAELVLAPVGGTGKPYKTKTRRIIDLLEAGIANETVLRNPESTTPHSIRTVYPGKPSWLSAEIPEALAALVLAPVEDGTSPSITARLIELLHFGLQSDTHTQAARSRLARQTALSLEYSDENDAGSEGKQESLMMTG